MKDSQQNMMSVEVPTQNAIVLKALSPVAITDSDLYSPIKNGGRESNGLSDAVFDDLQVEEEEEAIEKSVDKSEVAPAKEMPSETEDEILNKFDTPDTLISDTITDKLEDKLLEDLSDLETDTSQLNGSAHDEPQNNCSNNTPIDSQSLDDVVVLNHETEPSVEDIPNHTETLTNGHNDDDNINCLEEQSDDCLHPGKQDQPETKENNNDGNSGTDEHNTTVMTNETDDKSKEEQDAELLKDQIMDTEDLLQIIEDNKDTPSDDAEIENDPSEQEQDHDHDEYSDIDKLDEEFDTEHITTDDDQTTKEDTDAKDINSEADTEIEDVTMSESDIAVSNENSNTCDKEDELVIDEKSNDTESIKTNNNKDVIEEISSSEEVMELEATSCDKDDAEDVEVREDDTTKAPEVQMKTTKRTLSDTEAETEKTESKKPKLADCDSADDTKTKADDTRLTETATKICNLNSFRDFMRNKSITRVSRTDLEEFCLQKMCEAIFHKSAIGELRHQLGVQEQMVDMWRKEIQVLQKQARDLEIVNKRLLHEVRLKNDRDKPLIPVKITRSVGLQVRSDSMVNMITPKRRPPQRPLPGSIIQTIAPKPVVKPTTPTTVKAPTSIPNLVKSTKILTPKANALLTQALASSSVSTTQNKSPIKTVTTTNTTPLRVIPVKTASSKTVLPKVTAVVTPTLTTKPVDKAFIDLTDEEDRRPQSNSISTVSTTTTANVRIVKATPHVATSTVGSQPRIMYVYNNQFHQGVLAADPTKPGGQKLMLKLNSNMMTQPSGVFTTVPSGSLSVGGALRPGQPVRLTTPVAAATARNSVASRSVVRHPAPLPLPPQSQASIAARKPIPPRPHLTIRRSSGGIVLSWKMPYNLDTYEAIASYQLYAYQETSALPSSDMWRKVGDVKALALPMACTLTQFADGNKYHFAVRAVDVHKRMGQFSEPEQILL